MNPLAKAIFWGVCATLIFLPLPYGSDVEWAVFVFQCATFLLFVLHLVNRYRAGKDPEEDEIPQNSKLPLGLRVLLLVFLGTVILQLIPLPYRLVEILSPQAAAIYGRVQATGTGAVAKPGWFTLSIAPGLSVAEIIKYFFYVLFAYLAFKYVRSRKEIQIAVLVLVGSAVFQAFYGLIELLGGTEKIFGFQRSYHLGSATGTYINRDHFSGLLEMIFPLSLGFLLAKARFFSMKRRLTLKENVILFSQEGLQKALVFGLMSVIIGLGIFFSRSRSGIFVFFVTIFLMVIILSGSGQNEKRRSRIIRSVLLTVVFASALIGIKPIIERFSWTALTSEERPVYYKNTVAMIGDFPLSGTGLGTYVHAYPMYQRTYSYGLLDHAHNDYLELAAESGLVGAGALVAAAFGLVGVLYAWWTRRRDHLVRGVVLGCLLGIVALFIHSLTDFNLHIPANAVYFLTLYALALRTVGEGRGGGGGAGNKFTSPSPSPLGGDEGERET